MRTIHVVFAVGVFSALTGCTMSTDEDEQSLGETTEALTGDGSHLGTFQSSPINWANAYSARPLDFTLPVGQNVTMQCWGNHGAAHNNGNWCGTLKNGAGVLLNHLRWSNYACILSTPLSPGTYRVDATSDFLVDDYSCTVSNANSPYSGLNIYRATAYGLSKNMEAGFVATDAGPVSVDVRWPDNTQGNILVSVNGVSYWASDSRLHSVALTPGSYNTITAWSSQSAKLRIAVTSL